MIAAQLSDNAWEDAWLPFLILVGIIIWAGCTIRGALRSVAQAIDDHARELRRANELRKEPIERRQP